MNEQKIMEEFDKEIVEYWKKFWFDKNIWSIQLLEIYNEIPIDMAKFWLLVNQLQLKKAEKLKQLIISTLKKQKDEFREMVEKMEKDDPWAYGFDIDMTNGYNQALKDILKQL